MRRWTVDEKVEVIRAHERLGCSLRELGRRLGLDHSMVRQILRQKEALLAEQARGGTCPPPPSAPRHVPASPALNNRHVCAVLLQAGRIQPFEVVQAPRPPSPAILRRSWRGG